MRQLLKESRSLLLIGLPALVLACGDSGSPSATVAGNYTAIVFVTTPTGGSARNELQAGSTLALNLNSNGTTSGHLHIAANGSNPVFDADMAGTWSLQGNVVEITQAADTFVRDIVLTVQRVGNAVSLIGDQVFSGTRINLTVARG